MKVTIDPSQVSGSVFAPPSKSAMQRACAAALVKGGVTKILRPGISNDDRAALDIIQQFGAVVSETEDALIIDSTNSILQAANSEEAITLNCGESGLSIRMFTPIAALSKQPIIITGGGSLRTRPMNFFDEVLPQLDVKIITHSGKVPLHIQGPLVPANITVDGSLSSQFLTGLLMAYAAARASDVTIEVTDLKSKPYIDLTLQLMQAFGLITPRNEGYKKFHFQQRTYFQEKIKINKSPIQEINYTIEGDWSGGAFLLVAGAIASTPDYMIVEGLKGASTQADIAITEALRLSGADFAVSTTGLISIRKSELGAFEFDATDCPDLFPPLVALAAYCKGSTTIKGVSRLASKESNRGLTLQEQFGKMGVAITLENDVMTIVGGQGVKGANVHSCHDHRIAMACAVAALGADGATTIEDAEAIDKSYPEFYQHLQHLGAFIKY